MAVLLSLLVTFVGSLTFGYFPVCSGRDACDQHALNRGEACETEDLVSLLMRGSSPSVRRGGKEDLSTDVQGKTLDVSPFSKMSEVTLPQIHRPGVGVADARHPSTRGIRDNSASSAKNATTSEASRRMKGGWTDLNPMSHGASDVSAAKVGSEIVVALGWEMKGEDGGEGEAGCAVARTRIYDLKSGAWRTGCDAPMANYGAGAASYNNMFYAAGGWLAPQAFWEYHLRSDTWTKLPALTTGRIYASAVALGRALWVIGGWLIPSMEVCGVVESYSFWERKWTTAPYLKVAVGAAVAAAFHGKIYVFGGYGSGDVAIGTVQIYESSSKDWSAEAAKMPTPRGYASLGLVGGKMFIVGGYDDCAKDEVEAYDPAWNVWDGNYKPMTTACAFAGGCSYKDKVYIFGGTQANDLSNMSAPLSSTGAFCPWSH